MDETGRQIVPITSERPGSAAARPRVRAVRRPSGGTRTMSGATVTVPGAPEQDALSGEGAGSLADLLAAGERAAFHGPPAQAVGALEKAIALAGQEGRRA